jgi:hypothetical protein
LLLALDHAEVRFDVVLYPMPDLDVSWRLNDENVRAPLKDLGVRIGKENFIAKLQLDRERSLAELASVARRLTNPYQVIIHPRLHDSGFIKRTLKILTAANPFTPLELIFLEPDGIPDTAELLTAAKLQRPHFVGVRRDFN